MTDEDYKRVSHYSEADIERIIASCPKGLPERKVDLQFPDDHPTCLFDRRTVLKDWLEGAALNYKITCNVLSDPKLTPSQAIKQLQPIESATDKLLRMLDVPKENETFLHLYLSRQAEKVIQGRAVRPRGVTRADRMDRLRDSVEGVKSLHEWAVAAIEDVSRLVNVEKDKSDRAVIDLIQNLGRIWEDIFEQPIRTSVGNPTTKKAGQAIGPMVRYIQTCLVPINVNLTDEAVRDRIRTLFQGKGKSGQKKT